MTPEQIEQMEAALVGATPNPWMVVKDTYSGGFEVRKAGAEKNPYRQSELLARIFDNTHKLVSSNAALIALAPEMAAHIIAQREQIEALQKRVKAALERLDASLFTNAEHQQAKAILRATGGQVNE